MRKTSSSKASQHQPTGQSRQNSRRLRSLIAAGIAAGLFGHTAITWSGNSWAADPFSPTRLPVVKVKRLPPVGPAVAAPAFTGPSDVTGPSASKLAKLSEPAVVSSSGRAVEVIALPAPPSEIAPRSITAVTVTHRRPAVSGTASVERSWLRSSTSDASFDKARKLISRARREFQTGAWVSSEESTWQALRVAAQGIDQRWIEQNGRLDFDLTAIEKLQLARIAIIEARDFGGLFGPVDSRAIARMTRSHQTDLLKHRDHRQLTSNDASECYLDHARVHLADLASSSPIIAEALDLLAATILKRNQENHLPGETALCLRRAAIQGQPQQGQLASKLGSQLADLGLLSEAQWALQHSLAVEYQPATAQRLARVLQQSGENEKADEVLAELSSHSRFAPNRKPNVQATHITRLSPAQFAAVSAPVQTHFGAGARIGAGNDFAAVSHQTSRGSKLSVTPASAQLGTSTQSETRRTESETSLSSDNAQAASGKTVGAVKRWFDSLRKGAQQNRTSSNPPRASRSRAIRNRSNQP